MLGAGFLKRVGQKIGGVAKTAKSGISKAQGKVAEVKDAIRLDKPKAASPSPSGVVNTKVESFDKMKAPITKRSAGGGRSVGNRY